MMMITMIIIMIIMMITMTIIMIMIIINKHGVKLRRDELCLAAWQIN